jgi:DNA (cytosine-5)-methyltransferase 1
MVQPTHIDLFSGIGGFSLAAKWAGFRTVLHCEIDPYCQKVLRKNFPEVPIHGDIRTLIDAPSPNLLTGGFPCQPFSAAGRQRGAADDRHLWPEMLRLIRSTQPDWVCGENVGNFVGMALDEVCADLEDAGYEVRAVVLPACSVGASHRRDRCFVLAHTPGVRQQTDPPVGGGFGAGADERGVQKSPGNSGWPPQSTLCRVAYGVPNWVDRIRSLGNAVVPQQVYPILAAIAAQL